MTRPRATLLLIVSHALVAAAGFALAIYLLPPEFVETEPASRA